jgi:hypothetical protein
MTPPIERVRYFDGEYLRAFDFAAEQGYHVDMRRRLNMALHLYGIVEGLQLGSTTNVGITEVSISAGMAIDLYGREIYLLAPYTFDDVQDVQANRITVPGDYQIWIQYVRQADTPPSNGYAACNQTSETTRWRETCRIVLLSNTSADTPPAVTDDISEEDPDPDTSNGVLLGVVTVTPGAVNGVFTLPQTNTVPPQPKPQPPLAYIGLRAQQIQPPNFPDTTTFDPTSAAKPLTPPIGVEVQSNLFADQNLIVGTNFNVKLADGVTVPSRGNVKIGGDVFLSGDLYLPPPDGDTNWQDLKAFIQSQTPDVLVGIKQVTPGPSEQANGAFTFTVPSSRLKQIGSVNATASIAGIQWNTAANVTATVGAAGLLQVQIISVNAQLNNASKSSCDITVNWSVSPTTPNPYASPIQQLWISYVAVCYPPS